MSKLEKLYLQLLKGNADGNISFQDLMTLLKRMGFKERVKGSHHIFTKVNIDEILNIQPKGNKAKPYQVKQIRGIIVKYKLNIDGHE